MRIQEEGVPWEAFPLILLLFWVAEGTYALLEARAWKPLSVTEGCVQDYEVIAHPNDHNIRDLYFTVGGTEWHLNDGYWVPGFKAIGSFGPGDRVRVSHRDRHVTYVEKLP